MQAEKDQRLRVTPTIAGFGEIKLAAKLKRSS
jgi:hypothetical protein